MSRDNAPRPPFQDRSASGRALAKMLEQRALRPDIVLAIPRGGLPLGRAVADALFAPLDVVVASKMGAPDNPEFAIGAVAADGSVWLNDSAIERHAVQPEYVERVREREMDNARQKADRYRDEGAVPDVRDQRVLIVDDGIATGSTARACIEQIRSGDPEWIALAVPVGPSATIEELSGELRDVVVNHVPEHFRAVGEFYREFEQISDEQALEWLEGDE